MDYTPSPYENESQEFDVPLYISTLDLSSLHPFDIISSSPGTWELV